MKETIIPAVETNSWLEKPRLIDRLAKTLVLNRLQDLSYGELVIVDGDSQEKFGRQHDSFPVRVTLTVHDPRFYSDIAFGGSIGAGESYMQGLWQCDNLTDLVRILLRNRAVLDGMDSSISYLTAPLHKIFHWFNRNTISGSQRNIQAHYDLGNELFKLFLDDTMMYSSGIFPDSQATMHQASLTKLERICQKLDLQADDHVLEIGTGWGGFAIYAAQNYGCRVTTTTISKEQYALATQRITEAGLDDRITVLCSDYRDLEGQYDKLVSIEMIEAIGYQYYDTYFAKCSSLLKPDGLMLLQAITISDQRYEAAKRAVDFIQRYIFPGSCIPSVSAMTDAIKRKTDMRLYHLEDIGPHYATTLRHWRERFFENIQHVRQLGYPNSFVKMWEFYLCYCEGGFTERAIGDVHMLLTKPLNRTNAFLPGMQANERV